MNNTYISLIWLDSS